MTRRRPDDGDAGAAPIPRGISPGERAVVRQLVSEYAANEPEPAKLENLFRLYLEEILGWTRDSNLVARGDLGRLASRHLSESLAVLPLVDRLSPATMIDLGSGAGFPAIPVQIARPGLHVTMVESRRRKGLFLGRVVQELELANARVNVERAEHLDPAEVGTYDLGTARAVAPIAELLGWLAPLVRPGGHAVLFKGSSHPEELRAWEAEPADNPSRIAWELIEVVPVAERHLWFALFQRRG